MNELQIEISSKETHTGLLSFTGCLTAILLYMGLCGTLFHAFLKNQDDTPVFLTSAAGSFSDVCILWIFGAAVILAAALLCRFRFGKIVGAGSVGAGFLISLFVLDLPGGLCSMFNRISLSLGSHMGKNLVLLSENEAAIPVALFWTCLMLSAGCVWVVRTGSAFLSWILFLLLLAADLGLKLSVPYICLILFLAGLFFLRFPSDLLLQPSRTGLALGCICFVICAASAAVGMSLADSISFSFLDSLHDKTSEALEAWRFGTKSGTGLPDGDFKELDSQVKTDRSMLRITMDQPDSYYLRGFVGTAYHSDGWKEPDPVSLSDGAELFYWLHRSGFYGLTQLSQAACLLDHDTASEAPVTINIEHTGASRKYLYAPYELLAGSPLPDPDGIGDVTLHSDAFRGLPQYTLTASHNQVKRYASLSALLKKQDEAGTDDNLEAYLTLESHYNAYVYEHFLDVPDDLRKIFSDLLGTASSGENPHTSYQKAKQTILSWLNENIQYAVVIPERKEGTDFLTEFLLDTKSGYDVHYASAAVMMMRYLGIPARYVEGYLISPEKAAGSEAGTSFELTELDSHAWAEIYQDGIGWIPFEVTPEYLGVMEQEDRIYGTGTDHEAISADSPNQTTPEDDSLEMTEDEHDDPQEEDEPEKKDSRITAIIRFVLLAFAVLLLILFLLLLTLRIIRGIRRYQSFRLKDRSQACKNLYTELHRVLGLLYSWTDCVMPSYFTDNIRTDLGEEMVLIYEDVLNICEKAAFSSHPITEEEYRMVFHFVRQTHKLLRKRIGFPKSLTCLIKDI